MSGADAFGAPPLPEIVPLDLHEEPNQDQPVGLGITQPGDSNQASHLRSPKGEEDTSEQHSTSDQASARLAHSDTSLLDKQSFHKCPIKKTIVHRRLSWVPATVLVLAVCSTLLSGLYFVVALIKPRYGKFIGVDGKMAASTASLLSMLFAKIVELSYVTICVAFLGQVLTRRAITKGSRGISISDMSMRTWLMQPGAIIVHWESLRYSGWTVLGVITLTATVVAMLYTTAAEALVTPKLKWGSVEDRILVGDVYTSFANVFFLSDNCETSVALYDDVDERNNTCLNMQHAGQAFHNYQAFLHEWALVTKGQRPSSSEQGSRPRPTGSVHENTTVEGSWINRMDMDDLWKRYDRVVHNITAAMPHAGVIAAANHRDNDIIQPKDKSGEGMYELEASVSSPAVNVLCAGMNATELAPIVYAEWPNINTPFDPITWTTTVPDDVPNIENWHNRTVVDDIFEIGPDYPGRYSPIFGKLPSMHNSITNVTGPWNNSAIWLLGATNTTNNTRPNYILCRLKAKLSPLCSTRYIVTASGSRLYTVCEEDHPLQYNNRVPEAPDGVWENDWKSIAAEWAFSLSLNAGITDGAAAGARLLMQFVPKLPSLDPEVPSISEALAVLAGNTLLMSSANTPFVHFWNYTEPGETPVLAEPARQNINATLRSMGYASGGTHRWQGVFYPVLVFAFVTSALCLAFMVFEVRGKQITDFTEPHNLFALAMNSPSTTKLQGACGSGPEGRQLGERWYVAMEEDDEHYYIRTKAEENTPSASDSTPVPMIEMGQAELGKPEGSPALREYKKLSTRKSWLSGLY
ncbi:hypothetical protein BDV19DRAFT_398014 [Aspergillus venezuelensis]